MHIENPPPQPPNRSLPMFELTARRKRRRNQLARQAPPPGRLPADSTSPVEPPVLTVPALVESGPRRPRP